MSDRALLVRMPAELHAAVKAVAEKEDRSMAQVAREALRVYTTEELVGAGAAASSENRSDAARYVASVPASLVETAHNAYWDNCFDHSNGDMEAALAAALMWSDDRGPYLYTRDAHDGLVSDTQEADAWHRAGSGVPTCPTCEHVKPLVLHGSFTRRSGETADTWTCDDAWHRAGSGEPSSA